MIEIAYLQNFTSRMNEPQRFIQVIVGPRQVGKTTMVNQRVGALSRFIPPEKTALSPLLLERGYYPSSNRMPLPRYQV